MKATLIATTALLGLGAAPALSQTVGISIPAATHGWAGALNFHAERTVAR
ncbi:ABC transporter substrate-binding protein, partial [Paracoccus gahaiensis]